MSIVHPSKYTDPRDLQVGVSSQASHDSAVRLARALIDVGVPCAVHQFPEFNGNWWAVCVNKARDLKRGQDLARAFDAGWRAKEAS